MDLLAVLEQLRGCRWVDLTHAFAPGIPHFAAFPDEERTVVVDFPTHGFLAHRYAHVGQWGTHMDPPSHFVPDGRTQDEVPVTEMVLPLVVLDVRDRVAHQPDLAADPDVLAAHEAEHGRVPGGAFVALLTGWGERWPDGAAMRNTDPDGVNRSPGWSAELLRVLVEERGVVAVGHDTTDTDPGPAISAGATPAETYLLEADRWQLELVAGLDAVPPRGALVVATWPKPLGGSGFPARAFAICP